MSHHTLAQRVRRLRLQAGMSQSDLARAVSRDRSWVAHLERGTLCPTPEQVRSLARRLGVPPARLSPHAPLPPATPAEEAVRRFRTVLPPAPARPAQAPPVTPRTAPLLEALADREPRLWSTLARLGCTDEDSWVVALALAGTGAVGARLAPARIGLPLALFDDGGFGDGHRSRPVLLRPDPEPLVVLLADLGSVRRARLPLLLAAAGRKPAFAALGAGIRRVRKSPLLAFDIRGIDPEGVLRILERLARAAA